MRRLAALAMVTLASLVVPAAPAAAVGSISAGDGVLYDDCRAHPYSFAITPPPGTDSWSMDVTAYGPDGTSQASDFVYDDISTGVGELLFCGYELPGQYELVADVEYSDYDSPGSGTSTERLTTTFAMRQPMTRTRLQVSSRRPSFNAPVRFVITSKDERPAGYFATSYTTVRLQKKVGARWVNVRGGKGLTDSRGKEVMTFRWNVRGRMTVRAMTLSSSAAAGSVSTPVSLRTR